MSTDSFTLSAQVSCYEQYICEQGKEILTAEDGTILADAHIAMVDSTWYMWLSVDPLVDKYLSISPYAYCNNNPLKYIDPDGRSYSIFDEEGNYIETIHDNWWHNTFVGQKGRVIDSEGNVKQMFSFADPQNDVADLKSGAIIKFQFVQESDIVDMLKQAGAFDKSNRGLVSRFIYMWNEGQA